MEISYVGPTLTVNTALSKHWRLRHPIVAQWRKDFAIIGTEWRGKLTWPVGFDVRIFRTATGKAALGDAMAHAILAKAAIDGLVDAEVLPEDDRQYVKWVRCYAPEVVPAIPRGFVKLSLSVAE